MAMKILLIQPPVRDFYFTAKRSIPYGLISIAASLREAGFDVELIDALSTSKSKIIDIPENMNYLKALFHSEDISPFSLFHDFRYYGYSFEHLGNLIAKSEAELIGISSLFSAYSDEAHEVAKLVKEKLPEGNIVFGGHHATSMYEQVLQDPAVDFVIRGDGEIALVQLALALTGKRPLEKVEGLVFKGEGGVLKGSKTAIVKDLDALPLPAIDLLNNKFYGRKSGGSAVILGSRGCPMKCSYCCMSSHSSIYRKRSVDSVFSEMKKSYDENGVRFFDFEDENLTLDKEWFYSLIKKIQYHFSDSRLELRAMNGLYPPTIDDEMLLKMKQAGFRILNLSLCTTVEKQLKRFMRADVKKSVEKVSASAKAIGLEVVCYIIAGAPGQYALESVEDLIYLNQLGVLAGVSIFYPAPGSIEYDRTKKRGLLPDSFGLMRSSVIPVSDTTTRLESVTLLRLARILNFLKKLRDEGKQIKARPFEKKKLKMLQNKEALHQYLLETFLHDGHIRALRSDGSVYNHEIVIELSKKLIQGIGY